MKILHRKIKPVRPEPVFVSLETEASAASAVVRQKLREHPKQGEVGEGTKRKKVTKPLRIKADFRSEGIPTVGIGVGIP